MQSYPQYFLDRLYLRLRTPHATRQVAALPYKVIEGRVAFLLVTSRRSGRWIFPKGSPIEGLQPWEAAAQEALEEAGVEGEMETRPLGTYRTIKKGGIRRLVVEVDLYPMRVTTQHAEWPEKGSRHRHWVLLPEAKRLLNDPVVADLTVKLSRRLLRAGLQPVK
jgi:8-oxo-dGTP pyrophosphatase MutT (NUDIX family)